MSMTLEGEPPVAVSQPTIPPPPPEALAYAQTIAATLGETEEKPIIQIDRIVATLGPEETDALVGKAQAAFAGEGVLTQDGSRKRNLGQLLLAGAGAGRSQSLAQADQAGALAEEGTGRQSGATV